MKLSPAHLEAKAQRALDRSVYFVTIARPLLEGMLSLLKAQRVEIDQLRAQLTLPAPGCTPIWIPTTSAGGTSDYGENEP